MEIFLYNQTGKEEYKNPYNHSLLPSLDGQRFKFISFDFKTAKITSDRWLDSVNVIHELTGPGKPYISLRIKGIL